MGIAKALARLLKWTDSLELFLLEHAMKTNIDCPSTSMKSFHSRETFLIVSRRLSNETVKMSLSVGEMRGCCNLMSAPPPPYPPPPYPPPPTPPPPPPPPYRFSTIFLKLHRCFVHGLRMCIWFGPLSSSYFFTFFNL